MNSIIFVIALIFSQQDASEVVTYVDAGTEETCMEVLEDFSGFMQENLEELQASVLEQGADDMVAGCFTQEEATTIFGLTF